MIIVLSTFPKQSDARRIAKQVIQKRLAGCVLAMPVGSTYRWKGKIRGTGEVLAVFKTTRERAKRLMNFIETHHQYDVPFVATVSLGQVSKKYLKWIEDAVK